MLRSSMAAIGAAFVTLGNFGTAPATAALLDFDFTTEGGATGSFTLDTDTAPDSDPAIGINEDGSVIETGFSYPNAVSNFSVLAQDINLSGITTDFGAFSAFPLDPPSEGILSSVEYPSGCLTTTDVSCSIDVDLEYSGNISELPVLSDDPRSYSTGIALRIFNPTSGLVGEDPIAELTVVPEPSSTLSTLAVAVGGAGLLLKRTMNRKRAAGR